MFGQGFTCPALLVFTHRGVSRTGLSPAVAGLSRPFRYPPARLRAVPGSLAATSGISVDFFSSGYLDVSVPPVRPACLWIRHAVTGLRRPGSPIRAPPGHRLFAASPTLFAGCRALLRLPPPRHPPYALVRLAI
jgi:hypothetical protein